MIDLNLFGPAAIPWYKSKIVLGAAVSIISKVAVVAGIPGAALLTDPDLANGLVLAAGAIGDVIAVGARVNQTQAPKIVATKSKAQLEELQRAAIQESQPAYDRFAEELQMTTEQIIHGADDSEVPSWMR